jgi:protein-disulfide isomerase
MIRGSAAKAVVITVLILCAGSMYVSRVLIGKSAPADSPAQRQAKNSFLSGVCGDADALGEDSCSSVVASRHGKIGIPVKQDIKQPDGTTYHITITHHVPVALFAWCYYAILGVWFLCTGTPTWQTRRRHVFPLLLSLSGVGASLNYISVMWLTLETWCPLCVVLHVVDFVLAGLVFAIWPRRKPAELSDDEGSPDTASQEFRTGARLVFATVLVAAVITVFSFSDYLRQNQVYQANRRTKQYDDQFKKIVKDVSLLVPAYEAATPVDIPVRSDAPTWGRPDAANEVVLFSDLQCPHCRSFEKKFVNEHAPLWNDNIKLVFRHFPLCSECNRHRGNTHPLACQAAYAVEAARLQMSNRGAQAMHDLLLQNHAQMRAPEFAERGFTALAAQLRLDVDRFKKDMASAAVKDVVKQDIDVAFSIGVKSTPTVFLNGRKLKIIQRQSTEFWKALAEQAVE